MSTDPQPGQPPGSFLRVVVAEIAWRIGLALLAMGLAVLGAMLFKPVGEWGSFGGAVGGLAIGVVIMTVVLRRRSSRG